MNHMRAIMQTYKTVQEWRQTIGENIRNLRLQRNLDRRDLAAQAGVALNAVKNLELGKNTTTETLIRVVRILDRTDWFDSLAPTISVSPMAKGNLKTPRQRVFKNRKIKPKD